LGRWPRVLGAGTGRRSIGGARNGILGGADFQQVKGETGQTVTSGRQVDEEMRPLGAGSYQARRAICRKRSNACIRGTGRRNAPLGSEAEKQ